METGKLSNPLALTLNTSKLTSWQRNNKNESSKRIAAALNTRRDLYPVAWCMGAELLLSIALIHSLYWAYSKYG